MPSRTRPAKPQMYNTPPIRNAGFGALQVEALTNRPLSISRRHFAASQLRMRDIEPHELSSSEWVRFLVMEERERERFMTDFRRRRRNSDESTSSAEGVDGETAYNKAEEARLEAVDAASTKAGSTPGGSSSSSAAVSATMPAVSAWVRRFDAQTGERDLQGTRPEPSAGRPLHARRAVTTGDIEAPPSYDTVVRAHTPPPAYEPGENDGPRSPAYERDGPALGALQAP